MYENFMFQGKSLSQWQKEMNYEFSLGELYRMVKDGCDIGLLSSRIHENVTFED